jgi:toxin ParE1/3/4
LAYQLSIPAAEDIEHILRYTLENWGPIHFERYYHLIEETLHEVGMSPGCLLCRSRDDLFLGCRSRSFGKHVIFYREKNGSVEIIRILHQSMDYKAHLP